MNRQEVIALKVNLPRYLSELSNLFGRPVSKEELLSPDETAVLQQQSRVHKRELPWRVQIPFSERLGRPFKALLSALEELNPSPVYVWIKHARECGVPRPTQLRDVHFDFDFAALPSGIVSISTSDLADDMVLEFSKDENHQEILLVEVSGPRWRTASY